MPFDTETMVFDKDTNHYLLTEEALRRNGIFLRERIAKTRAPSPEYIINGIILTISDMVYDFIHDHSMNNDLQDCLIGKYESARKIIEKAMLKQAKYYIANGNLNLYTDDNIRSKAMSPEAVTVLNKTIPELRCSILYTGV